VSEKVRLSIIAGNENYEVTEGEISLDGEDLSELAPEEKSTKEYSFRFIC
jgi:Fe-S cluster assembly ATPase SufC